MKYEVFKEWVFNNFGTSIAEFVQLLDMSPSSKGYIQGAASELELKKQLETAGYTVERIKEKPAGGFDEKKPGYKGDFLIHKENGLYYVIECKGIKTNAEFRQAEETDYFTKVLSRKKAISFLKKYININKKRIYDTGLRAYNKRKKEWEKKNPGKEYPKFSWDINTPGPDSPDLTAYFTSELEIENYVNSLPDYAFTEEAFRNGSGAYKMIQTHKPSGRTDPETGIKIAAPLKSDFSLLAVDLFQRIGIHKFVFVNPDIISSSPENPNHLYQNYLIDIIIPGIKDNLDIKYPWYEEIDKCIKETNPRVVTYDESQLDHR